MRIFVIGTRGIPDIPGGVEKHCQELYPRIVRLGHSVWVCTRTPYLVRPAREWNGVNLVPTYAPRIKSLEAIAHTMIALCKALFYRPDVVHIHAVGPALLTPVARLLRLKVVVTNHGPDYERKKWGRQAKAVLRLGEWVGCFLADAVIAISPGIVSIVRERTGRIAHLIRNGVVLPEPSSRTDQLQALSIQPGNYILAVARFVPEKGLDDLILAFQQLSRPGLQLVIAGNADHETDYSRRLQDLARCTAGVVLTGYLTGERLRQVYAQARLFVLPSYHEGLPISMLEAMSFGLNVLASDIAANQDINLPPRCYFQSGSVAHLTERMQSLLDHPLSLTDREALRGMVQIHYNWDAIADQTLCVYEQVMGQTTTTLS